MVFMITILMFFVWGGGVLKQESFDCSASEPSPGIVHAFEAVRRVPRSATTVLHENLG